MGYGSKLKELLDERGITVSSLAKQTGIPATTVYTSIKRDTSMRYDYALRISMAYNIPVEEICQYIPKDMPEQEEKPVDDCCVKKLLDELMPAVRLLSEADKNIQKEAILLFKAFTILKERGRELINSNIEAVIEIYFDAHKEYQLTCLTQEMFGEDASTW